jgi:RHS repeat-associated protein
VSNRYLYGGSIDEVLADQTPTTLNWALADRLGTLDLIVDESGGVIDRVTFDSFGNKVSESAPDKAFRFGFTGRELDPETGLYYYRARYYDPLVGRFISVDSIGFQAGDTNLYRYVFNSPTQGTDPTGHEWWNELGQNLSNAWSGVQNLNENILGTIDNVVRYSSIGVLANITSATTDVGSKIGTAINEDWKEAGRNTDNIFEQTLLVTDKVIAGFADTVTLGGTTKIREGIYGDKIKSQHRGALFNTGQVLGVAATIVLGFATPNTLVGAIGWGGRFAQGYTVATTAAGAYNTTTKIINGEVDWKNPLSYLEIAASYAPAIGFAARIGGQKLLSTQIGQKGLKATSEFLEDISPKIVEFGKNSFTKTTSL